MAHLHDSDARRSFGDKLDRMTGSRGEHPIERAARIAGTAPSPSDQGDAARSEDEVFTRAPPRQISNYGTVRK